MKFSLFDLMHWPYFLEPCAGPKQAEVYRRHLERLLMPMEEGRPRFQEGLEIIRRAWTEERFSFEGDYYSYHDVSIRPRPLQTPHPSSFLSLLR